MKAQHVRKMETTIKQVATSLGKLGNGPGMPELLRIIHRPGFTTPAEIAFILSTLEAMLTMSKALAGLKDGLLAGSRAVGSAER